MASLERFQLDYIRDNALNNQQTRDLLKEKDEALKSLHNERSKSFNAPNPKLTPDNDITIDPPSKSKGLDPEVYNQKYQAINDHYNEKIGQSTKDYFREEMPKDDSEALDQMSNEDLALLLEKDSEAVLDKQKKELDKTDIAIENKELEHGKDEVDITMSDKQSREIFNEPEKD